MSQNDNLTDHDYDGIRECDNNLPSWWLNIFYVCILFSIGYIYYYHLYSNGGLNPVAQFEADEKIRLATEATKPPALGIKAEELVGMLGDKSNVAAGGGIYKEKCAACHGQRGEGLVGPNLTDSYWLHGGRLEEIAVTIQKGVPEKGMISWSAMLSEEDIERVTVYVKSLKGSNPSGAKAPEGKLVENE